MAALVLAANANQKPDKIDTSKWQSFSSKNGEYKIKTPDGWAIADPNDESFKQGIEKVKKDNPNVLNFIPAGVDQYDLFLLDFSNVGGSGISNFNLKILKDSGLTAKMYPDLAKEIIKQAKLKKSGWKLLDLPCGKSITYWGVLELVVGEGKKMEMNTLGYVTVKANMCYISSMVTSGDMDKVQRPVFEAMAQSITLK